MEYIIVAFRSRANTIKFYEILRNNNIYAEIVNTPKEAGVGCGLSVKVNKSQLEIIKRAIRSLSMPSFAGIFLVNKYKNKTVIRLI